MTTNKASYTKSTLKFCIAGLFIPALTVYAIVGLQIGIETTGIECTTAWTIIWTITTFGLVTAPFVFIKRMNKKLSTGYNFTSDKLLLFNVVEFTFIQCTLASFLTTGQILCYGNGGQNGLEFIFTGWLALPFLVLLSIVFDRLRERKIEEVKTIRTAD
jgi:hypothetical protein